MSIKPLYSHQIITQKKTIEIRKKIGTKFSKNEDVYIYSSFPDQKIIGKFQIESLIHFDKNEITEDLLSQSCLTKEEMLNYIQDKKAFSIKIKNVILLHPLSLNEIKSELVNFRPPQSYRYLDFQMKELFDRRLY